jgi:hypothetical protein
VTFLLVLAVICALERWPLLLLALAAVLLVGALLPA